jgi:hypothetical protein
MMKICQFAALMIGPLGLCRLNAQTAPSALDLDRSVVDSQSLRKAGAVHKVVNAFNVIGMQAASLRKTMGLDDAIVFDELLLDVMTALAAIPEIGLKNWNNPDTIRPERVRPDRLVQLPSNLAGLDKLFLRVRATNQNPSERKLLAAAQRSIGQISEALPEILPTVAAKSRRK